MEEEKTDLIDTKVIRREFINKILVFGTLALTVVITAVVSTLLIIKAHNEKILAEYCMQMEEFPDEGEEQEEQGEQLPLPVYTENAKNRIQNIYVADSEEKIAYLTFDDGPSSNITPQILQILRNEEIKATFFVLGSRAELYPELVKQAYDEGHYIANHGYSHNYSAIYSSTNSVLDEYNKTENAIRQAVGNENYSSYLFRFPGGSVGGKYSKLKKQAIQVLDDSNIAHVDWNALTNDSVGKPTAESIMDNLRATTGEKKRIVVLMHDAGGKQLTADTLGQAIAYLREKGYYFKNFYDIMCE